MMKTKDRAGGPNY